MGKPCSYNFTTSEQLNNTLLEEIDQLILSNFESYANITDGDRIFTSKFSIYFSTLTNLNLSWILANVLDTKYFQRFTTQATLFTLVISILVACAAILLGIIVTSLIARSMKKMIHQINNLSGLKLTPLRKSKTLTNFLWDFSIMQV